MKHRLLALIALLVLGSGAATSSHAQVRFGAQVDFAEAGDIKLFLGDETMALLDQITKEKGYLDGSAMATTFNMLRANDLIWSFVVNNYLMGRKPAAFDVLYWNADTTRLSARLHADFIALMETNAFAQPGGMSIAGQPLDLRDVRCDSYIVAGRTDHITPWTGCYGTARLFGADATFVLANAGIDQSNVEQVIKLTDERYR